MKLRVQSTAVSASVDRRLLELAQSEACDSLPEAIRERVQKAAGQIDAKRTRRRRCSYCGGDGGRAVYQRGDRLPNPEYSELCPRCDGEGYVEEPR